MKSHFVGQPAFRVAIGFLALACVAITASAQAPTAALAENSSAAPSPHASTTSWWKLASTPDLSYVIGADDVIVVDVWHEQELSKVLSVRPDGKISLPLVGELQVGGQTPLQLQDTITQRLKEYLEHPQVTVIVQETKSQKFNIVGEVQRPGSFGFGHPVTVVDAIALAGGLRDFAKSKKMYVLRTAADVSQQRLPVNYKDVVKGKNSSGNVVLHSHDTLVVP